jgi:hypothetical protein
VRSRNTNSSTVRRPPGSGVKSFKFTCERNHGLRIACQELSAAHRRCTDAQQPLQMSIDQQLSIHMNAVRDAQFKSWASLRAVSSSPWRRLSDQLSPQAQRHHLEDGL